MMYFFILKTRVAQAAVVVPQRGGNPLTRLPLPPGM